MRISREDLPKLQRMQTEMLVEFDRFCDEYKIRYVIFSGTLLGAVRNGGFIPWDDDADVALTRREYEKLKKYAGHLNPDICVFQDHSTDADYLWGYGKLRRPGTLFLRTGQEHLTKQAGVYVDVFPMDDIPNALPLQFLNYWHGALLRKALWAKAAAKDRSLGFLARLFYGMLARIPTERVYRSAERLTKTRRNAKLVHPWCYQLQSRLNPYGVSLKLKYGMDKRWYTRRKQYPFEGHLLWGPADADGYLSYTYGNYMTLPPEEERRPKVEVAAYRI